MMHVYVAVFKAGYTSTAFYPTQMVGFLLRCVLTFLLSFLHFMDICIICLILGLYLPLCIMIMINFVFNIFCYCLLTGFNISIT